MTKLFNQVTRSVLEESEVCMPLTARFGSGGENTPIILQKESASTKQQRSAIMGADGCSGHAERIRQHGTANADTDCSRR